LFAGGTIRAAIKTLTPKQRETNLELPSSQTKRWSSRRKAVVIVAIRTGILSRLEA
jgi:hypothetical protein